MILSVCVQGQTYKDRKQNDGWWRLGKKEVKLLLEFQFGVMKWMWELVTHSVKALYPTKLETPKRQKKIIKLGEGKRKKKNMAIEVFLPIDVLVIPFGPDVSTQF